MIHASLKYEEIQDPTGRIGKDEPVFVLRGSDIFMVPTMMVWCDLMEEKTPDSPEKEKKVREVQEHVVNTIEWQKKNGCGYPD